MFYILCVVGWLSAGVAAHLYLRTRLQPWFSWIISLSLGPIALVFVVIFVPLGIILSDYFEEDSFKR